MNTVPRFRRRHFFLPRTSQPKLLLGAQLIFVGLVAITGLILLIVTNRDLTASYMSAHLAIKNVQEIILPTLVLVDLLGLILGAAVLLFYTHRIAGPVYRLCQILQHVSRGDLSQDVSFRQADYLQELAAAASRMMAQMRIRVGDMQKQASILENAWERGGGSALSPESQLEVARAIRELRRMLDEFKLE
jgi:HAMP domain-containing protein